MLRVAALALLVLSVLLLAIDAPGPTWRELWFLGEIFLLTIATRSMSADAALSALSLGLGVVVMMMVWAGRAINAAGIDTSEGPANWGLIPILEESLKLVPVAMVVVLYRRRSGLAPNPSDLLMLGCFAGAGFAMAENALLVQNSAGIARDMARQYGPHLGPLYLVPGAWGAAGYVGHAAATGLACAAFGLALGLRARLGPWWPLAATAGFAWIVVEHVLTNYYVGSGSRLALALGNGRLTPWIFIAVALAVVALDWSRARFTLAHSATLRRRVAMARAAFTRTAPPVPRSRVAAGLLWLSQLRAVNATAWFIRQDPRLAERKLS
jgi:RsiW-degrading membrane proteinase PrsW (M82 family)